MGIWKSLKRRIVAWHNLEEWVLTDVQRVHEVVEEYDQGFKADVRWAKVYQHVDTGETRVRIGTSLRGFPSVQTGGPPGETATWGRVGRSSHDWTSIEIETFIEENQTWEPDQ